MLWTADLRGLAKQHRRKAHGKQEREDGRSRVGSVPNTFVPNTFRASFRSEMANSLRRSFDIFS